MGMQGLLLVNELPLLLLQWLKLHQRDQSNSPLCIPFLCVMPGLDFLAATSPTVRAPKRGRLSSWERPLPGMRGQHAPTSWPTTHPPDGAHGEVEAEPSSQRASSSRGTSATHGRGGLGPVAPESTGPSASDGNLVT